MYDSIHISSTTKICGICDEFYFINAAMHLKIKHNQVCGIIPTVRKNHEIHRSNRENFNIIIFSLNNHSGQNLTQIHRIDELSTLHLVSDVRSEFRLTSAK